MKKITFEFENITPMFMYGNNKSNPEFRMPSFKGVLRFWWRSINYHLSINDLRNKEAEIFGGADNNNHTKKGKSKTILKLQTQKFENIKLIPKGYKDNNKKKFIVTGYKDININNNTSKDLDLGRFNSRNKRYTGDHKGIAYLYMMSFKNPFINLNSKFAIQITTEDIYEKDILNSLWCLSYFGGLGSRSRRGGGNIRLISIKSDNNKKEDINNFFNSETENKIKNKIELTNFIKKQLSNILPKTSSNIINPEYAILNNSKIYIFEPEKTWIDALNNIGKLFEDFRHTNKDKITETPNFGFPITHTSYPNGKRVTIGGGKVNQNGIFLRETEIERSASPLIFRIIQTDLTTYFPVIIWLNSKLLPTNYMILPVRGYFNNKIDIKPSSSSILQDFFTYINKTKPDVIINNNLFNKEN